MLSVTEKVSTISHLAYQQAFSKFQDEVSGSNIQNDPSYQFCKNNFWSLSFKNNSLKITCVRNIYYRYYRAFSCWVIRIVYHIEDVVIVHLLDVDAIKHREKVWHDLCILLLKEVEPKFVDNCMIGDHVSNNCTNSGSKSSSIIGSVPSIVKVSLDCLTSSFTHGRYVPFMSHHVTACSGWWQWPWCKCVFYCVTFLSQTRFCCALLVHILLVTAGRHDCV